MSSINGLGTPLSGMRANQFRQDVTANNVANVNTPGFQPSTVQTTDTATVDGTGNGTQVAATYSPSRSTPAAQAIADGTVSSGAGESSNVDAITERTNQMGAQSAYSLNAASIRTADDMARTLIDMQG